jgi:hypothetical protein
MLKHEAERAKFSVRQCNDYSFFPIFAERDGWSDPNRSSKYAKRNRKSSTWVKAPSQLNLCSPRARPRAYRHPDISPCHCVPLSDINSPLIPHNETGDENMADVRNRKSDQIASNDLGFRGGILRTPFSNANRKHSQDDLHRTAMPTIASSR